MKSVLIANWKMNPETFREARRLFDATRAALDTAKGVSLIVAPPVIFLRELSSSYKGKKIGFALQNAHFEKNGAFTGETSLSQGKDAKVSAVIIGHAERRAMGETNEETRAKINAALSQKITPILCIGEHARSGSGEHFAFVKEQIKVALQDVLPAQLSRIMVAYEPIWAIGATQAMNPTQMHEMAIFIRKTIVEMRGEKGMSCKILYGGSIDETNAREMLEEGDVEGFIVGRASADAEKITSLIRSLA